MLQNELENDTKSLNWKFIPFFLFVSNSKPKKLLKKEIYVKIGVGLTHAWKKKKESPTTAMAPATPLVSQTEFALMMEMTLFFFISQFTNTKN